MVQDEYGLSEEEKHNYSLIEDTIKDIQIESDNMHNKLKEYKGKLDE